MSLFNEWTAEWGTDQTGAGVIGTSSNYGDAVLELDFATNDQHAISWDSADVGEDVEALSLLRVPNIPDGDADVADYGRVYLRGGGTEGNEDAYVAAITGGGVDIEKIENGTTIGIDTVGTTTEDTWYWLRFRATDAGSDVTNLKVRFWEFGVSEPTTWDYNANDESAVVPDIGWIGVGSAVDTPVEWDWFSTGTGGLEAISPVKVASATGTGVGAGGAVASATRAAVASGTGVGSGLAVTSQQTTKTEPARGAYGAGSIGATAFGSTTTTRTVTQTTATGAGVGTGSAATPSVTASATATGTGLGDGLSTPTKIKVGVASGSGVATGSASGTLFVERTDLVALTEDTILNWPYDFQYFRVKDPHGQYLKAYVTELLEIQNQADAVRDALLIETAPLPELKRLAAEINVNQRAGESVESFRYRTRLNKVNAASNGTAKDIETILGVAFDGKGLRGIDVSHVSGDPIIQFEVPGNFLDDVPISRTDLENLLEKGFSCGYGVEVVRSDTWLLGESGAQGIGEGGLI